MRAVPSHPVADALPADTRQLDPQQRSACRHLLGAAQRSTHQNLPDDDAKLARWARVDLATWRRIKPVVMASWTLAAGRWTPNKDSDAVGTSAAAASDALRRAVKPADLRALARQHGARSITLLAAIMDDPKAPLRTRLTAAQTLLDRGFARPTREADREAAAAEPIKITRTFWVPGPDGPVQVG